MSDCTNQGSVHRDIGIDCERLEELMVLSHDGVVFLLLCRGVKKMYIKKCRVQNGLEGKSIRGRDQREGCIY